MTDHVFVDEEKLEPEVRMLLRENNTLKNWVIGILQECDGCREQASQWANALAADHEAEANGEVPA